MQYIVSNLTVELENAPLGMDEARPRFGWRIESDIDNVRQNAYRVTVYRGDELAWDSGIVESSETAWIEYSGEPLMPCTEYVFHVLSFSGEMRASAESRFETGLMDQTYEAWRGAEWIGSDEIGLAARAKSIFAIDMRFRMHGQSAGIVFGKNDPRLADASKNDYGIAGESAIRYIVSRDGTLSIYRAGYSPEDSADAPIACADIPGFDPDAVHELRVEVTGNNAYAYMDGTRVDSVEKEFPRHMTPPPGMPSKFTVPRQLNPAGDNDLPTYPLLCECGVISDGGCEVERFAISNLRPPKAVLVEVTRENPGKYADMLDIDTTEVTYDFTYGGTPVLMREFTVRKRISRARIYATARGVYELELYGKRVGDRWFEPGASQYDKHLRYQVYDVTSALKQGDAVLTARLASGWWNESQTFTLMNYNYWGDRQSLLAMLIIEYSDGDSDTIVTSSADWLVSNDGPVVFAGWFYGEHYDARREETAWRKAVKVPTVDFSELLREGGFHRWPVPTTAQPALEASVGSPVKAIMTLTAKSVFEPRPGVYVFDMGQNMVGVPRVVLRGKPGTEATLRYGEVLYPNLPEYAGNAGMILTENYRDALSIDRYIFASYELEEFMPRFTFHGYRYIEISGVAARPELQDVQGVVLSSVTRLTGDFTCSDDMVNRLYQNIRFSQYANFISIPTDCPQRNERMGWSGDAQVFSRTAVYNADVYAFLRRYLECARDCQLPDGRFADIAPVGGGFGGIEWGSAGVIITYELYRQYGDKRVIEENYPAMMRYIDFLRSLGTPGLLDNAGQIGDWLATDMSTDNPLLWNAVYYLDVKMMSEMAAAIGDSVAALEYSQLSAEIKRNWNSAFVDPISGKTRRLNGEINDTQASYAVPFHYGLFDDMDAAGRRLAERTKELDYTVTTGFVGTGPLLPALTDADRPDIAYRVLRQRNYPSWLYSVSEGATTIWERWNSVTRDKGFGGNNSMNSFNHYSLGAVGAWMYAYCLGISRVDSWKVFKYAPKAGSLDHAEGFFDSIYGTVRSEWRREGKIVTYHLTVPANTKAIIELPGISKIVGSGEYEFICMIN